MKESVLLVWAGHEFLARGRGPAQMLLCFAVSVDSIGMGNRWPGKRCHSVLVGPISLVCLASGQRVGANLSKSTMSRVFLVALNVEMQALDRNSNYGCPKRDALKQDELILTVTKPSLRCTDTFSRCSKRL